MRRNRLVFILPVVVSLASQAHAGGAGEGAASAIPSNVLELIASGNWMEGDLNGTYRAVSVATGTAQEPAVEVYLQWLAAKTDGGPVEVIRSVPVKEFNDKKLATASISMETEIDGQADLVITGQDGQAGFETLISLRATKPGIYEIQTRPAQGSTAPAAPPSAPGDDSSGPPVYAPPAP